jgi:hypothetical protein
MVMKRAFVVLMILFAATGVFAQNFTFSQFQTAFQDFAHGVASALPLDSSVGLNWSDAYIGQLPHFGLGATVGAATIPFSVVSNTITELGGTVPSNLGFLSSVGIPLPAYSIDLRIGGFILPFDIGLKFGYLPPNVFSGNFSADYLLWGGDFRYMLVKDHGFTPGISVGVGFTHMSGEVALPGVLGHSINVTSVDIAGTPYTLGFTDPSLQFAWSTNVIDLKIQLSKNLLLITPYVGAVLSYGISNAGGGMQSAMTLNTIPVTQQQIDQINSEYGTNFTYQNPGFGVNASANGVATRVFGGLSVNLFILKVGVGAEYELLSGSWAGMANVRLQF